MCSGGRSGYFDCHLDVDPKELLEAMTEIEVTGCAENFSKALETGSADDYQETDGLFYELESEYLNLLQSYINKNISEFFEIK